MKKRNIDFMANRKKYWLISLSIFIVGILFNIIFGTQLDIKFTGGSVFKYSYADSSVVLSDTDASGSDTSGADIASKADLPSGGSVDVATPSDIVKTTAAVVSDASVSGSDNRYVSLTDVVPDYSKEIDPDDAAAIIERAIGEKVTVEIGTRINIDDNDRDNKNLTVKLTEKKALDQNGSMAIASALKQKYPNVEFTLKSSSSVNPVMGKEFFWKCMIAVILASAFMVIYVALRFKKVGGWTAGVSGIAAIVHDVLVVYFVFVIFRYPIDDNFMAVVLGIIGYSLNSTIVIFDRVRENRRLLGPKVPVAELANVSMNETLGRTINTNLCVFMSIAVVAVISIVFKLDSIRSFAVPMMFGTLSGCYSSLCISNSIWVSWQEYLQKKDAEKNPQKGNGSKNSSGKKKK